MYIHIYNINFSQRIEKKTKKDQKKNENARLIFAKLSPKYSSSQKKETNEKK